MRNKIAMQLIAMAYRIATPKDQKGLYMMFVLTCVLDPVAGKLQAKTQGLKKVLPSEAEIEKNFGSQGMINLTRGQITDHKDLPKYDQTMGAKWLRTRILQKLGVI